MKSNTEIWETRLSEWEASGLTQQEYSRRNGISPFAFSYWKKKIRGNRDGAGLVEIPVRSRVGRSRESGAASPRRNAGGAYLEIKLTEELEFSFGIHIPAAILHRMFG